MKHLFRWLFTVALLAGTCAAFAQTPSENGLIPDDEGYDRTPLAQPERADAPDKNSLRPYCPTPADQGNLPSCIAMSLAAALTIQKAIRQKETNPVNINKMAHSSAYIYNQVKKDGDCDKGSTFTLGLNLAKEKGVCLAETFDYPRVNCQTLPQKKHHQQAASYKIADFNRIFERKADAQSVWDVICAFLAENKPVLIAMKVPADLRKVLPPKNGAWKAEVWHAMVVTGYDYKAKTFELMNSYGPAWGDKGFCTIGFNALAANIQYGYVLELPKDFGKVK